MQEFAAVDIETAERSADTESARRGVVALAHPVAVGALALWLFNDHVLKSAMPGPLTGKLSDIAGAIVVPLVVATILEPVTRHALRLGMAAAAVVLSAINLIPVTDLAYERVLSLVIPSTNTMDATDLVAVPAVLVAGWVWRRAASTAHQLRRAWGYTLLGLGVVASMATSADVPLSQEFSGTHFLTPDDPSVELAVTFEIAGEEEFIDRVFVDVSTVILGASNRTLESPVVVTKRGVGEGTITLALRDPEAGPVEVSWTAYAEGVREDVCVPFCFFSGEDEKVPTLTIEAPPDTFGPQPIATAELGRARVAYFTIDLVLPAGANDIIVRVPGPVDGRRPILRHDGVEITLEGDSSTVLAPPEGCAQGCSVELLLSVLRAESLDTSVIQFYSAPNEQGTAATGAVTSVSMNAARLSTTVDLPPVETDRPATRIPIAVRLPEAPAFGDVLAISSVLSRGSANFYNFTLEPELNRTVATAPDRCFRIDAWVSSLEQAADGPQPPANPTVDIAVALLTADPLGGEVVMEIGNEADDLCGA